MDKPYYPGSAGQVLPGVGLGIGGGTDFQNRLRTGIGPVGGPEVGRACVVTTEKSELAGKCDSAPTADVVSGWSIVETERDGSCRGSVGGP